MRQYWAINGRFLAQKLTGVQRYARQIVTELDQLLTSHPEIARGLNLELLAPPDATLDLPLSVISTRTVGPLRGHLWEQLVLPANLHGRGLLSLCNTGPVLANTQIVCIHDTNTRNYPKSYSPAFRALYRALVPALGHKAEFVATVSHFSAGELVRHGICRPDNILVAPNGHEHALEWRLRHSDATRLAAGPTTIVLLGSAAPHKNARLIIDVADKLHAEGFKIAVVGVSDPRIFKQPTFESAANVFWLGRLSDAELAALLRDSMCLAFPSLTEGFGLPPLEAMALGCPVVVSDRASLPEICGDAALYASPDNSAEWLDRFMALNASPTRRCDMIERGLARISHYRWKRSAELYLHAMWKAGGLPSAELIQHLGDPNHAIPV
ncbi:glycosyltransferase involved in cell wall biosynthesis [Mesorhizobium soli]|uniref:glycosyltransferase family 4 protein n=1 Tax=Pseudaminobacter soli (ex Li et al. 2025) TaxID=1295366 RepID=UPI00247684EA|nr:glycosyltransferase family 1 protein [Mesorhizobium soli]MDH6229819.1 glycosyltransferase involved in cell wall biosynthesis [Mesorhizobium soli]